MGAETNHRQVRKLLLFCIPCLGRDKEGSRRAGGRHLRQTHRRRFAALDCFNSPPSRVSRTVACRVGRYSGVKADMGRLRSMAFAIGWSPTTSTSSRGTGASPIFPRRKIRCTRPTCIWCRGIAPVRHGCPMCPTRRTSPHSIHPIGGTWRGRWAEVRSDCVPRRMNRWDG